MKKIFNFFNKQSLRSKAGLILILGGLFIGGAYFFSVWQSQRTTVKPKPLSDILNQSKPQDNGDPLISGAPVRIQIPSVNIDLKVIPGYYNSSRKSWTLSLNDAQFATTTAKPNNKEGNTFIYAHNRVRVFYTLPKVKSGDEAIITSENGHVFRYKFNSTSIATPSNINIFNYTGKPILTLQTCTGIHFENRQFFVFNFEKVS